MEWTKPDSINHLEFTSWQWLVSFPENLVLGNDPPPDIGAMTYLQCKNGITIESGCLVGSHCSLYSEDTIGGHSGPVIIKSGAKVGSHSVILPNVVLAEGILIPAFSLVKKSILNQDDLDKFLSKNKTYNFNGMM